MGLPICIIGVQRTSILFRDLLVSLRYMLLFALVGLGVTIKTVDKQCKLVLEVCTQAAATVLGLTVHFGGIAEHNRLRTLATVPAEVGTSRTLRLANRQSEGK